MPSYRVRDDDESTIVEASPTLPLSMETMKVQWLLISLLASATIALALALPMYGQSTFWVGPVAIFLAYVYGTTFLVKIRQQQRLAPAEKGKNEKKVPIVTRRATAACAWVLCPIWIAACAIGLWRAVVDLRASGDGNMEVAWVVLRMVECLWYLGGGITLAFVGLACQRERERVLKEYTDY